MRIAGTDTAVKSLTPIGLRIPSCTLRLENHLATVRKGEAAIVSHCNSFVPRRFAFASRSWIRCVRER